MLIDCNECTMQHTDACADCIVTYLLDRPEGAVVFDVAEERALRVLHEEGLAPANRFQRLPDSA
jgi:Zn-finger protein